MFASLQPYFGERYRKQCETYGEYVEAKKARGKLEELKSKEATRQRQLVLQAQNHEMREVATVELRKRIDPKSRLVVSFLRQIWQNLLFY